MRLVDWLKQSVIIRWLRRVLQPGRFLRFLKRKKIFGLTYLSKEDLKYMRQVRREKFGKKDIAAMEKEIDGFPFKPKISVVMPVYNVEARWLERAIESVLAQAYPRWEFCIADDASPSPHIKEILRKYEAKDDRFKIKYLENNQGISGASNEAMELVTGEYVALLDHDDEFSRDALFEVVKLLNTHPDTGLIYSDEDKLSMGGMRLRPVIKGKWDPDLFLTHNYLCHIIVCRTDLIKEAGGFRKGFEGSQDYDLLLRVTELTDQIHHIPKVLYHWRMIPGSAAAVVDAKSKSFERAQKALEDTLKRRRINGAVTEGEKSGTFRVVTKIK